MLINNVFLQVEKGYTSGQYVQIYLMKIVISLFVFVAICSCSKISVNKNYTQNTVADTLVCIDSLINISQNYFHSNNFNDSIFDTYLQQAYQMAERNALLKEQAKVYQRLGRRYRNKSEYGMALYYYEKSLEFANIIDNDSLKAHSHHEMAVVFRRVDDNAKALYLHFKALEWAESAGDTLLILSSYNGIGNVHHSYKHYREAIRYFHKSLKILEKGHQNRLSEAINTNNIGESWLDLGNPDSSLYYVQKSYQINIEIKSKLGQAICKNGMGNIYFYLKDYPMAIKLYNESIALNRDVGNLIYVAGNLINLGETYLALSDYESADKYLTDALKIAKKIGAKSNAVSALSILSDVYAATGKLDKSVQSLKQLIVIKDSITQEVNRLNSKGMNALYLMEKQEREILILKQKDQLSQLKLTRQRNMIISSIIIIFGGLLLIIYIMYQRKQKNKYIAQIELQNKSIRDSINYAQKIQSAILPDITLLNEKFNDHFILFKPRDVVSGDFYWFTQKQNQVFIVTADSTGHGVPGALMSMLGIAYLNEIVNTGNINEPHLILNKLREQVVSQLNQSGRLGESKDGMELSLFAINVENNTLKFSGANNPLYIIRNHELIQLKADKIPIGFHPKMHKSFTTQTFKLQKGDCVYSTSDGYADQFSGSDGTKFLIKNFKQLLLAINHKPMAQQQKILDEKLESWRGQSEQIDDIIVMGIRI